MVATADNNKMTNKSAGKSYFTPCRRLGLSRRLVSNKENKDTDVSTTSTTSNVSANISTIIVNNHTEDFTPPENLLKSISNKSCSTSSTGKRLGLSRKINKQGINNASQSKTCQKKLFNTVQNSNEQIDTRKEVCKDDIGMVLVEKKNIVENYEEEYTESLNYEQNLDSSKDTILPVINLNKVDKPLIDHDEEPSICKSNSSIEEAKEEENKTEVEINQKQANTSDDVKNYTVKKRKRKSFLKSIDTSSDSDVDIAVLPSSQSSTSTTSENNTIGNLLKCTIQIERTNSKSKSNKKRKKSIYKTEISNKKINICNSSSEEDFVPSSFIKSKSRSKNSFKSIEEVNVNIDRKEKQIMIKEKILAELESSERYKKLHNLKELEISTKNWKNGFERAFSDLYSEVCRNYPDITVSELVSNLNLPKSVVKQCNNFLDEI